jgi:hypothetical protein
MPLVFATKSLYRLDEVTYDEYIYNTNQFSGSTITFEYLDPNLLISRAADVTIYPSQSITISGSATWGDK